MLRAGSRFLQILSSGRVSSSCRATKDELLFSLPFFDDGSFEIANDTPSIIIEPFLATYKWDEYSSLSLTDAFGVARLQ